MLCNSKTHNQPDKALQKALLKLAFSLMLLSLSLIWFFTYPPHQLYSTVSTSLITIYCLITAIKTLTAGEAAISYGGFANEIIANDSQIQRIENPLGQAVLQNKSAKTFFKNQSVLNLLTKYLAQSNANNIAIDRLQKAVDNLCAEKVCLSLIFKQSSRIFNDLEYFEVSVRPIYLKKPQIFDGAYSVKKIKKETYLHWSLCNITAKQNINHIFKEEYNSLHNFLDYLPVGLYTTDKDFCINYANHNMANFLGLNPHQLLGTSLQSFLAPDSSHPAKQDFWRGTLHFINKSDEICEAQVFQTSYRENEKIMFRGVVVHELPTPTDLQQQVNKSLDDINWLFNNSPIGILFTDAKGNVSETNPKAKELFGLHGTSRLFDILPPQSADILEKTLSKSFDTLKPTSLELKTDTNELSLYINSLHHMHQKTPITEKRFIIYAIDVTKQKNLEMQFAQAQKMQAVGQLAGGVAHDFNNLLTAMIGFTDLLLQRHGVGDPSFADLIQIKQNANRATSLVRQLLAFSRKQPLLPKLIDITDNFADLSQMLKRILGEKIKLVFNHGSDLGYCKVDPNQFSQVIVNLAVNAKDAMNGNGTLTISTTTESLSEPYIFGNDIIPPGNFIVIRVSDTGCGIAEENLNRIFDPFFSTKENIVGSGTGLGLAMVYGIVRQTEGFIKVDSVLDKGTTFAIYLPRFDTAPEDENSNSISTEITDRTGQTILKVQESLSTPANINQKIIMGLNITNTIDRSHTAALKDHRPARILFVEDEDSVRTFGVRALKKKGYDVVDSISAENALEILEKDPNFDLLLTDMVLPGLSGAQLTNKVKEKMPKIAVILASGYSEDIARQEVDNINDFDFITKPYSLGDLTAKVFDVLNRTQ